MHDVDLAQPDPLTFMARPGPVGPARATPIMHDFNHVNHSLNALIPV